MKIQIYTDGSCIGNPGPGGWAFLMRITGEKSDSSKSKEIRKQGGEAYTTNNRMELLAVIEALRFAEEKYPSATDFTVYSDSSWVVKTMTDNWKRKKNLDLWEQLTPFLAGKQINWRWVKGHAGHPENEDCDVRALREAGKQKKRLKENPELARKKEEVLQENLFD